MGLEAQLIQIAGPVVSNRFYPDIAPDNPAFPFAVYQQVGGKAYEYADQTLPDHENARVQIVTWGRSRLDASNAARAIRQALLASSLIVQTITMPISIYQEDLKLYGSRTDFGIWYIP